MNKDEMTTALKECGAHDPDFISFMDSEVAQSMLDRLYGNNEQLSISSHIFYPGFRKMHEVSKEEEMEK